jgi:hypothetical protein
MNENMPISWALRVGCLEGTELTLILSQNQ